MSYRIGRTEDQRWTLETRDHLDAEGGLPCTGRGHDMKFLVTQVKIKVVQDPLLVASPRSVKVQNLILRHLGFLFLLWFLKKSVCLFWPQRYKILVIAKDNFYFCRKF